MFKFKYLAFILTQNIEHKGIKIIAQLTSVRKREKNSKIQGEKKSAKTGHIKNSIKYQKLKTMFTLKRGGEYHFKNFLVELNNPPPKTKKKKLIELYAYEINSHCHVINRWHIWHRK